MSWATDAKRRLREGETISIRPRGHSMVPLIQSGELVTIAPVDDVSTLRKGDIVLVRVSGSDYLHLIKAIRPGPRFQIGNNRGGINGWAGAEQIFGRLVGKG